MIFPTREHQHGRVALEGSREYLCPLHAQADAVILDRGKSGLSNTGALRELILTKALQLANDAYRFAG